MPETIRGYELGERIGKGGFGEVYRAYQPVLQRDVAIKMISPQHANQPDFVRNFEREAQLVARLEHPHIVPLFDYWQDPDGAFLVMRFVRGGSLAQWLKRDNKWNTEQSLRLLDQISGALALAHRADVIHRDIKPDNILLDEDNAYLTDFGIAQIVGNKGANSSISGSLPYMAPEQLLGDDPMHQSDIYALALVFYELLTGEHVFVGAKFADLIEKHLREPIPNIHDKNPALPVALNAVLQRATQKNPLERYATVRDFYKAVQAVFAPQTTEVLVDETELINPYKGLRAFEQADANDFFGREALITQLADRLSEDVPYAQFLAVVGASGSGKSSVVKAGLIPALRKDLLPNSSTWVTVELTPSAHPIQSLAGALEGLTLLPMANVLNILKEFPDGLVSVAERVKSLLNAELFLFIDQFEEAFTLCENEAERTQFLTLISTIMQPQYAENFPVRVVVTLRADFYDRPLAYRSVGELFQKRSHVILPMNADEIERAIRLPAQRVGAIVEQNLIVQLVSDVQDEIGALPLLQYALTELFERRDGRRMTLTSYQSSGGVVGALARRADDVWQDLPAQERMVAQQLFLRLVTLGEGSEDTRRRAKRAELLALSSDKSLVNTVLDAFGKFRLLTFDYEAVTREPLVEVAHEALIRSWERLHEWLDTSRADIRQQRQLNGYAQEWQENAKRPDYLLTGARLTQFADWQHQTTITLTPSEHNYLQASRAEQERLESIEQERLAHEQQLEKRSRQVLRVLVGVLLVAFFGAVLLSLLAFSQRQEAQTARETSDANALNAVNARGTSDANVIEAQNARSTSDANAIIAENNLKTAESALGEANSLLLVNEATTQRTRDTQLAILLAIQSLRVQPSQRADIALQESLNELHIINRLPNSSEIAPALSPDGAWIAVQNTPTQIGIFDTLTQEQRHSLNVPDVRLLAWSNDGLHLLTVNSERLVQLWEVSTQQETARLTFDTLPTAVTLSADNRVVLATDNDTHEYWDMTNATRLTLLDGLEPMQPAFSPDGKWALATDSATDVYYTVDLGSGERVERNFGAQQGVYNMQQNKLYVLQADGQEIRLFNTQTWEYLPEPVSFSLEFSLPNALMAISQDDRFIAMSEEGGIIRLIDRLTGRSPRSFVAHTANITAIRFANSDAYEYREPTRETIPGTDGSGRTMLTQDATGMMILWDFNRDQQIRTYYGFTQPIANYLPNSDYIALTSGTESFVLDARLGIKPNAASYAQGQVTTVALTAWLNENQAVAFSPLNGTVFNPNTFNPVFTFYNRRQANSEAEFALSGNQQATPNAPQGSNPPQGQPPQGGNPPQGQPPQGGQPNQQTGNPSSSNSAVYSGFVSADGATIWYSDSREIKQYNVATQTTTTLPLRHAKALVALAVSADAEKIYALDADGNLVAWDTATRQPPTTQALLENTSAEDRSVFRLLLSTDNHYLLAYQRGISHSVVVFHVQEQTQTAIMCDTPIYDVSLVQNVAWVLCGQGLLRHTLINPNTTLVLEGFSDTYQAVAVAENGEWLALGSHTGNIDIYAQRELPLFIRQVVNVHQGSVTTIRFVRGDTRLISGGSDGFVAINAVTLDDLIDVACERITRDLTTVERTNFEVQNDQRTCG